MACKCLNPDGTFAQTCNGTCTQKDFKQSNYVEQRSEQAISDRFEFILRTFLDQLDHRITSLEQMSMKNWQEGYKQGYQDGREDY